MKLGFKRGQKGFTLVELMVVMAIMAVLASIVFPAVSGTQEVSVDSQTKQDASTVGNAVTDYFADQTGAEVITSNSTEILGSANNSVVQSISSRWPEQYLQVAYAEEFPTGNTTTVANVVIKISATVSKTPKELAEGWNAINLTTLVSGNYTAAPKSASDESKLGTRSYNNYLWLVKKATAVGGVPGGSRIVEVFKLTNVTRDETGGLDTLTYEKIY